MAVNWEFNLSGFCYILIIILFFFFFFLNCLHILSYPNVMTEEGRRAVKMWLGAATPEQEGDCPSFYVLI